MRVGSVALGLLLAGCNHTVFVGNNYPAMPSDLGSPPSVCYGREGAGTDCQYRTYQRALRHNAQFPPEQLAPVQPLFDDYDAWSQQRR